MSRPIFPARGFTLIELMVVTVIVALLAAIAYPSFLSQIRKGRRADAVTLMSQVQQAQERWRANNAAYTSTLGSGGLGIASATTSGGYYTVATAAGGTPASQFTVTATAQSSQASDAGCQVLRISVSAGNINYLAGVNSGSLVDASSDTTARRCWNR